LSGCVHEFESRYGFVAGASTHQNRLDTIRTTYQASGVTIDPHTADAVYVAHRHVEPGVPMLVLETAQPAKFSATIAEALGHPAPLPAHLADLESRPQQVQVLPASVDAVRDYVVRQAG